MTITPTYDSSLSRVRIAATSIGAAATAIFERSTDQISWVTVRGGSAVPVVSGSASLDDYEFAPDVLNYYRVSAPLAASFVAAGTSATANNASVTPGLPAGATTGDVLLLATSIRNSGAGTPNTPSGYTLLANMSNFALFGKVHSGSESAPAVTFAGGVANADTLARMCAVRNIDLLPAAVQTQLNGSGQNIDRPALTVPRDKMFLLLAMWKQDDWTSLTAGPAGFVAIGDSISTAGDDAAQAWSYLVQTTKANLAISTSTVTGGASAISRSAALAFGPTTPTQTGSVTPTLSTGWLKSLSRPFLNTSVVPVKPVPILETAPRHGVFDVMGRSLPVAVTDVRSSKVYELRVFAETAEERSRIELIVASGDPVFVQLPANSPRPSMYAVIGNTSHDPTNDVYTLPLRQVSAPGADVVGATATWQTVINTYATWADLIAAKATWADVLELVASPTEVIVP